MYRYLLLLASLALVSCSHFQETRKAAPYLHPTPVRTPSDPINTSPPAVVKKTAPQPKLPLPPVIAPSTQKRTPLAYQQTTRNGITLSAVSYDDRAHQLRVADQPNGLGSRWTTAQEATATYGGLAAINGGFFTPEGKPLGSLIETGTPRGSINQSSLGAGFYISSKSKSAIMRRDAYAKVKTSWNAYNLLQTGPMLAENGKTISGLSKTNNRPRSFIAWDGQHHWIIGHASACTLAQLSHALAGRTLAGIHIQVAVNLDGGRSSDLWVSSQIPGGGKSHRGLLNKPVRNYLVLTKR